MSVETNATFTITAPAGVDGYEEIAQLNGATTDTNFVGYLNDLTFAREVRESADNLVEGHGGIHGSFYSGRLVFSMEIELKRAATFALSNARYEKLFAALNAMTADGTISWTESGRSSTRLLFRQQQSPRGPDNKGIVQFTGVCESPYILSSSPNSSAPGTLSNAGKAATFPTFSFTTAASGSVVLSRTGPSPTEALTLAIGGSSGLAASTGTIVDFAARTVYQGSTNKAGAISWPSSVWWGMAPGSNSVSATGATSVTVSWRDAWLP